MDRGRPVYDFEVFFIVEALSKAWTSSIIFFFNRMFVSFNNKMLVSFGSFVGYDIYYRLFY
jgi:hypothetical protein